MEDIVLFHDKDKVRVGGVFRYDIYIDSAIPRAPLFVRVRNTELAALRAAYLNGPFTLYVDMMPHDYSEIVETREGAEPKYENHLKAGSHFSTILNVRVPKQRWRITISSEILFSRNAEVNFEIVIGTTKAASKLHGSQADKYVGGDPIATEFKVSKFDTAQIWQQPVPRPNEPLHVCVLTHGLASNVTADMLYLKEVLDQTADLSGENLVCKGYTGNACRTERGVKYLGRRLARWIIDELIPTYKPAKLSFIAHSLGGLVQTYALGYINAKQPQIFENIELVNFIALASPFLGISHENPGYVQFALSFGVVGKTGRDLGLAWVPGTSKPLLERLPGEDTLKILRRFTHRTVYANAVNDGIVPLRTASLLYLDWRAIGKASTVEKEGRYTHNPLHSNPRFLQNKETHPHRSRSEDRHWQNEEPSEKGNDKEKQSIDKQLLKPIEKTTSTLSNLGDNPFSNFLFGENHEKRVISRYQTINTDESLDTVGEKLPKKTSLIESGMSLLLPPHPDNKFITDPSCRDNVIFHDRVYYPQDLPERKFKVKLVLKKGTKEKVDIGKSEERIARSYHHGISWRKVLIQLLPEAHNNIIVRRRFSNAYGWPVIHHLAREHFLFPAARDSTAEDLAALVTDLDLETTGTGSEDNSPTNQEQASPWSYSDDELDTESEKDLDPHRVSMFKIIPN